MTARLLCVMAPENYARPIPRRVERRAGKAVTFRAIAGDGSWTVELETWHDGRYVLEVRDEHGQRIEIAHAHGNAATLTRSATP